MVQTPQGPMPVDQASQLIAQMQMQMEQMAEGLQEAQAGIDMAQIEAQKAIEVAQINATAAQQRVETQVMGAQEVAEIRGWIELLKAQIQPPPQLTADVNEDLAQDERKEST
jgi:hypothetical protein